MKLTFEEHRAFGRVFYYAKNEAAKALCKICKVKSLQNWQLVELRDAGFALEVTAEPPAFE